MADIYLVLGCAKHYFGSLNPHNNLCPFVDHSLVMVKGLA